MDLKLGIAALAGDVSAFLSLVQEEGTTIQQTTSRMKDTVLHLASKFNHIELVSEIIKLHPELVSAENSNMETPLHEACREGHLEVIKLLLEVDRLVAYNLNCGGESILLVASKRGWLDVVKYLLINHGGLIRLEDEQCTRNSIHAAATEGHLEIVRELLRVGPELIRKRDIQGCTPLHMACSNGHLEIIRELLRLDSDLCFLQDNKGRTPLHWAAIKGHVNVLNEILSTSLESADLVTKQGETVLHLSVKNDQYETLEYLMERLNITNLVNTTDNSGNTILHLAIAAKLTMMVIYLVGRTGINVNALNREGFTPLDIVEADTSNSAALVLSTTLERAGGKNSYQLALRSSQVEINIDQIDERTLEKITSRKLQEKTVIFQTPPASPSHHKNDDLSEKRAKKLELYREELRNVRSTITVVAVLIASVAFSAGINPPGGLHQEGLLIGKPVFGRTASYKVFMVCNNVALFLSLGIVILLVSVIPFKRKSMMRLLVVTHKLMWLSVSFMAAAYIAAAWVITDQGQGTKWTLVALVLIGGGCLLSLFVGLVLMFARKQLRKLAKRVKCRNVISPSVWNSEPDTAQSNWIM